MTLLRPAVRSVLAFLLAMSLVCPVAAFGDGVNGGSTPQGDTAELDAETIQNGSIAGGGPIPVDGNKAAYAITLACPTNYPGGEDFDCVAVHTCPTKMELRVTIWMQPVGDTVWRTAGTACIQPQDAPVPVVTPDRVLEAVRRIGLPSLEVQVQPASATLVNFDTIFYAQPQPFERTVQLLGYRVDVVASPSSYRWSFGDGAVATTDRPGAPFPAKDIVHQYTDAHVTQHPRVDVTYHVRFRVDGGPWRDIDQPITADGPATDLQIKEATPVLSGG